MANVIFWGAVYLIWQQSCNRSSDKFFNQSFSSGSLSVEPSGPAASSGGGQALCWALLLPDLSVPGTYPQLLQLVQNVILKYP